MKLTRLVDFRDTRSKRLVHSAVVRPVCIRTRILCGDVLPEEIMEERPKNCISSRVKQKLVSMSFWAVN